MLKHTYSAYIGFCAGMHSVLLHLVQIVMHSHEHCLTLQLPEPGSMLCSRTLQNTSHQAQRKLLYLLNGMKKSDSSGFAQYVGILHYIVTLTT